MAPWDGKILLELWWSRFDFVFKKPGSCWRSSQQTRARPMCRRLPCPSSMVVRSSRKWRLPCFFARGHPNKSIAGRIVLGQCVVYSLAPLSWTPDHRFALQGLGIVERTNEGQILSCPSRSRQFRGIAPPPPSHGPRTHRPDGTGLQLAYQIY